jgi:hypothetical protein
MDWTELSRSRVTDLELAVARASALLMRSVRAAPSEGRMPRGNKADMV